MGGFEGAKVLVLGAAGFIGSHLCDRVLAEGGEVLGLDNFSTGSRENLSRLAGHPRFHFREHDVTTPFDDDEPVDFIVHLASPASPRDYLRLPIETLMAGALGTQNALEVASRYGARFLLLSTSEVYGDAQEHPQKENYWGSVNPVGPRSVYDEAKRYAEALTMAYCRARGANVAIARVFNTYGPRMRLDDGRAVPEFIAAAVNKEPLPIHGDGSQTRSLCYVDDLVEGLVRLLLSDIAGPVNLGGTDEITVLELARLIQSVTGSNQLIRFLPRPVDDPTRRCPDTSLARETLDWWPMVSLEEGLAQTASWIRDQLKYDPQKRKVQAAAASG